MSFTFNSNIPAADNNPSDDQPEMRQNNQTHVAIWNVDHISFNNNDGGKHKQVTFQGEYPAGAPTNPESVSYTDVQSGSAFTNSQMYFRNQDSPYLLNCVRAFGVLTFSSGSGSFSYDNSYNMNTGSLSNTTTNLNLELNSNIVVGDDVVILAFLRNGAAVNNRFIRQYNFSNPNLTFTIIFGESWANGDKVNFVILQA